MIAGKPVVLVVDDDPVGLAFLAAAADQCGCAALTAGDAGTAIALPSGDVDLLLIDRCLPPGDGIALLRALRARGVTAPAIASSADLDGATIEALNEAGFAATLRKPATLEAVHAVLRRFVRTVAPTRAAPAADPDVVTTLLDDAGALAAIGGDRDALRALRALFAVELEALERDLDTDCEVETLAPRLHRLRASCGFCGSPALAAAAQELERNLRDRDRRAAALLAFTRSCQATRRALAALE